MISYRCQGPNLMNHCIQTEKIQKVKIEYNELPYDKWECVLNFTINNKLETFKAVGIRKRKAYLLLIKDIEDILFSISKKNYDRE